MRANRRTGFTLIELLVVVSIIALLIGILLPTLGEARRAAGYAACLANHKQLGIGLTSAVNDRKDQLPYVPLSQNRTNGGGTTGFPGMPANFFASSDFPMNGWGGEMAPGKDPARGWWSLRTNGTSPIYKSDGTRFDNTVQNMGFEAFWFMGFGNYMVESSGVAMLAEPFVSPAGRFTKEKWETYVSENPTEAHTAPLMFASYWYSLTTHVHPKMFKYRSQGGQMPDNAGGSGGNFPTQLIGGGPTGGTWGSYNVISQVSFPSSKAVFYQVLGDHQRTLAPWWGPGIKTTVSMMDGSARAAVTAAESAGATTTQEANGQVEVGSVGTSGVGALSYIYEGYTTGFQSYRVTKGGLSGRDFR